MSAITPTHEGFWWAKWRIKADGTENETARPPDRWQVVNVVSNPFQMNNGEPFIAMVAGVRRPQPLENFYWGERIPVAAEGTPHRSILPRGEAISRLRVAIFHAGSQTNYAKKHGFSDAFVSKVLNGSSPPSARMLATIGMVRAVGYRLKGTGND